MGNKLVVFGLVIGALALFANFYFSSGTPTPNPNAVIKPAPANSALPAAGTAPQAQVNPANQPKVETEAKPEFSEMEGFLEPFIYDISNRRNPFQSYQEYNIQDSAPLRPQTPAQRFDLDQLKLVAIIWDVRDPKAMIQDPDQEVIVLRRNEPVGNKNGYIATIREGEVVVVETAHKRGDIVFKTRVMRLER